LDPLSLLAQTPHRRYNPLIGEWVLVSPQRNQRPWQGKVESIHSVQSPSYDPDCYLCPGNQRAGGVRNPAYLSTFVFDNDFAALLPVAPPVSVDRGNLLIAESERGICRVLCFSPQHNLSLGQMEKPAVVFVVDAWAQQYAELAALDWVNHVQIFENRGLLMGASNQHPHCQIWANATIPNLPLREEQYQREFIRRHGRCLLCSYLELERQEKNRVVLANSSFVALVPFWAVWPFETLVLSTRHCATLPDLLPQERGDLADILIRLTHLYDRVFGVAFPYSMGFHQRPADGREHPGSHLHAHFLPPLLRSATIRKFMVGYELLAAPQRDVTPESGAEILRNAVSAS
jgi:UDPglucose--hexose-1-phosphate uridylyltransferase